MSERLTPIQNLLAAAMHLKGMDQHDIALLLQVNQGRVAEAAKGLRIAAKNPKLAMEILLASGKFNDE